MAMTPTAGRGGVEAMTAHVSHLTIPRLMGSMLLGTALVVGGLSGAPASGAQSPPPAPAPSASEPFDAAEPEPDVSD